MPWPRWGFVHAHTGNQVLLKTINVFLFTSGTLDRACKQRQSFLERSYTLHRRTAKRQSKGRIPTDLLYREDASRVSPSPFLLRLNWLEGPHEDKHAYWRAVWVSNIKLGQNATGRPSARQKLSDGKCLLIYVKKKINRLIDSFPASCSRWGLQPTKHLQAKAVSLYEYIKL